MSLVCFTSAEAAASSAAAAAARQRPPVQSEGLQYSGGPPQVTGSAYRNPGLPTGENLKNHVRGVHGGENLKKKILMMILSGEKGQLHKCSRRPAELLAGHSLVG